MLSFKETCLLSKGDWGPGQGERGTPHLPGGSVSPEIGEHPGEPVINLIQGQLPVRGFQNGLWARKKQRDPQSGPQRVPALCTLPQGLSLLPGRSLAPRAEETGCRSPWVRTGDTQGPRQDRLQLCHKGAQASRAMHLCKGHMNFSGGKRAPRGWEQKQDSWERYLGGGGCLEFILILAKGTF